ncbi:MAG: hypothetical protein SO181_03575 [Frisingicoccus sp.]|uniref:hypothetical protein n=1 Tax=Frisingicoccus sp. TaxID=1918627 RepID=UPI002A833BD4|nr:hypothetical protein [Frisingicoccus sp.]MDY4834214.1 hypothetical protein [Frisingicoccus sp.]
MKKKLWILGSCILLIFVSILGTWAAYTSRSFVKGVATTPKQGLGLSSDYLVVVAQSAIEDKYAVRKILLDEKSEDDATPYTFTFYIQNSSDGSVNEKSMQYTLTVAGLPANATIERDETDITVKATGQGATAPLMPAYTKTTHFYKVSIPKEEIKNVQEIVIKAIPDEDSDSSGNMLAAKFQPSVAGVVAGFSYSGVFIDATTSNKPSDFAAFNYEVMVFNATEPHQMVLTWNTRYVEIDPLFLDKIGVESGNSGTLEFQMDAEHNSYLIRFYRLDGKDTTSDWQSSWENLKNIITFTEKVQAENAMK